MCIALFIGKAGLAFSGQQNYAHTSPSLFGKRYKLLPASATGKQIADQKEPGGVARGYRGGVPVFSKIRK
jgi:hypothetical protein